MSKQREMHAYELPNRMDVPGDHPHVSGGDPILRSYADDAVKVYACGGLHYLRGNSAPYFSLTMCSWRRERGRWVEDTFGCAHDALLKRWPELAPLARLHLSDAFGVPMHAEANGWYQLACYFGGLGERFHAGNAETYGRHGEESETAKRERCLRQWADHVRIDVDDARALADLWRRDGEADARASGYETAPGVIFADRAVNRCVKDRHRSWTEAQHERWQLEADACVAALGLRYYYGERWVRETNRDQRVTD